MRWRLPAVVLLILVGCKGKPELTDDGGNADVAGALCGNKTLDDGETCDGDCASCDDGNACTADTQLGTPETCDVACMREVITACTSGDGCCPAGCNNATDDDCSATCGDNNIDPNETCDPAASCPASCSDGDTCTNDLMTGSSANCNVACSTSDITACTGGDMCCPNGCNATNDSDCMPSCGNGVVETDETCDPKASCPTSCDDDDACTMDVLSGSMTTCNATCSYPAITSCTTGDGCCPSSCTFANDKDCAPSASTPLDQRLTSVNITAPAGVMAGGSNWRIWGAYSNTLAIAPTFTVPYADCGTLVGYTTGTAASPRARVARLDATDALVTTYDLGAFVLRGLAAEPDGHWAALLWDDAADTIHVRRYTSAGAQLWTTALTNTLAAPDDFNIGESRLEYGNNRYGAYFHVHGISGFANGHEGDALHWIALDGTKTLGWDWGCSHSMSELLRHSSAANATLAACVTDCFPGTSPDDTASPFAATSIGGIYLNKSSSYKVRDFDGNCGGKVGAELGSMAPGAAGWKLVFNGHQAAAKLGQDSYDTTAGINQDIGFVTIANNLARGSIVWLTTTAGNEANSSIARWQPMGDATEQYVVGWTSAPTGGTYYLARVNATGTILESPVDVTSLAKWGRRDDPFRTHLNGDVVWAWFDSAGSSTLRFARLLSGGTATCAAL